MSTRPVIRIRPRSDARRIRRGFPWLYDNELVLDRRARSLPPGTIVTLQDGERQPLATGAFNAGSRITVRVLDTDPAAEIDAAWIEERLALAFAHRDRLYPSPHYRLVHAEADGFPGVVIDRFGDAAVIQPNAAWADVALDQLVEALVRVTGVGTVIKNAQGRSRALEGLDSQTMVLRGSLSGPIPVPMNGATYLADLEGGQKTGLFFDQRENHGFAARLAHGGTVLDVFSHVGGFGLAALAAGATEALAVDGSAAALELAEGGAEASGFGARFSARQGDAFEVMNALAEEGRSFDTVICDPPAFAPSRQALEAGLRAYERTARLASALVAHGGYLVLCSCSHAADHAAFQAASLRGVGRAGRRAQIVHTGFAGPDHPVHPALAESGYLKAIFLRLLA